MDARVAPEPFFFSFSRFGAKVDGGSTATAPTRRRPAASILRLVGRFPFALVVRVPVTVTLHAVFALRGWIGSQSRNLPHGHASAGDRNALTKSAPGAAVRGVSLCHRYVGDLGLRSNPSTLLDLRCAPSAVRRAGSLPA